MSATDKRRKQSEEIGWPVESYARLVALDITIKDTRAQARTHHIAKADIDAATGGLVHLETMAETHKNGAPLKIGMQFSSLPINGNLSRQHVFQVHSRLSANRKMVIPERISFLGRTIYNEANDGGDFNIPLLNNVFNAIGELNRSMRPPFDGDMDAHSPKYILKILEANNLGEIIGEGLEKLFHGIDTDGNFDFEYNPKYSSGFNKAAANDNDHDIITPSRDFARAMLGIRINTLDAETNDNTFTPTLAAHKNSGTLYQTEAKQSSTIRRLRSSGALVNAGPQIPGQLKGDVPSLFEIETKPLPKKKQDPNAPSLAERVSALSFFGKNIKPLDKLTQMRAIRVINRFLQAVQNNVYPEVMRDMVESDIADMAYDIPPPDKGESRFEIKRHMGNSQEKKVAGVGDQLGDCTEISYVATDKEGNVSRHTILIDIGAAFAPKESEYSMVAPDIEKSLGRAKHVFISHKHFDHKDGMGPYADLGLFASQRFYDDVNAGEMMGKVVHATPNVILHAQKMLTRNNVPKKLWPDWEEDHGRSWVHIRDPKSGKKIFSIESSAESSPHSARATPRRIIARDGKDVKFSLLKPGDTRYGRHLVEGHTGKIPVGKLVDEEFFSSGPASLIAEEQRELEDMEAQLREKQAIVDSGVLSSLDIDKANLEIEKLTRDIAIHKSEMVDPATLEGRRDILEIDCTNDKQPGFAPTELDVEQNELEVKSWFSDMASLEPMISTADARLETKLRVAVQTNCHISLGGANLKDAGIIANKTGVNKDLDDPEIQSRFIQHYLDNTYESFHALSQNTQELEGYLDEYLNLPRAGHVKDTTEEYVEGKDDFIKDLAVMVQDPSVDFGADDFRSICFYILRNSSQSNIRYQRQKEMEELYAEVTGDHESMKLGSVFVGYDADTFAKMIEDDHSRIKMPMTGTQGTENEGEAWWPKLVDGRSIFNANPRNRRTARPLRKGNYFILRGQTTIPGNESDFHEFLRESNETLRVPTIVASGRGFKIYNIDSKDRRDVIENRLNELGVSFDYDDGEAALVVHNMPIHASGHGYQKDNDCLIALVDPEYVMPGHTDDAKTVMEFFQRMDSYGYKNFGDIMDTFTIHSYDMGEKKGDIENTILGRTFASMILVRQIKEFLKQYGGYSQAQRVTAIDNKGGAVPEALSAGMFINPDDDSNTIVQHFNALDREKEDRESKNRPYYQRRSSYDIETDQEYKRYEGPLIPKRGRDIPGVDMDALLQELGVEP